MEKWEKSCEKQLRYNKKQIFRITIQDTLNNIIVKILRWLKFKGNNKDGIQ